MTLGYTVLSLILVAAFCGVSAAPGVTNPTDVPSNTVSSVGHPHRGLQFTSTPNDNTANLQPAVVTMMASGANVASSKDADQPAPVPGSSTLPLHTTIPTIPPPTTSSTPPPSTSSTPPPTTSSTPPPTTSSIPPSTTSSTPPPTTSSSTTTSSTTTSSTTTTSTTTSPATTTTPSPSTTSTKAPTSTTKPTSTTPTPSSTSPTPITSSVAPSTHAPPTPVPDRHFDGPSFIGGIVLSVGMMSIGLVAWKFYKARHGRNYHTL